MSVEKQLHSQNSVDSFSRTHEMGASGLKLAEYDSAPLATEVLSPLQEQFAPAVDVLSIDELVELKELVIKTLKMKRQEASEPYDLFDNGVNQ